MVKFPITPQGHKKLESEIKHLKYVERPAVIESISTAREFGDLSENAEYHAAREKQSFIEGRILDLESKFSRSEIIDSLKFSNDSVKFGATVKLIDDATEEEYTYHVVGEYEADIRKNRISTQSPLAKALIGKSVGDIVEVQTPKSGKAYEILAISFQELSLD
ncbi:MAG: transcription elongation factor GreA [Rickettsiaceae bacterium]|nr:transcription elongation factor GreA [Rickettsiaceae bacterium]